MTTHWPLVRLGELLRPVARVERVDPSREYRLLGARWYAQGLFIKDTAPGHSIRAEKLYLIKRGDFVYNRLFAWKGSFALAGQEVDGCHVSNEFPAFEIDTARLEPTFLKWWFSREDAWFQALGLSTGATPTSRNRLKESNLLSLEIPLPALQEQRRVVAQIESTALAVREAESLAEENEVLREKLLIAVHKSLSSRGETTLADYLVLDEQAVPVQADQHYPQVGIRSFGDGLFVKAAVGGSSTTYKVFNRLYSGALVLSQVKGWEGAVAVCPPALSGWYVSPEYRTFRCLEDKADPEYLAAIVSSEWFWGQLGAATRGVGARRERTRPEQFLKLPFSLPDLPAQVRARAIFREMDQLRNLRPVSSEAVAALLPAVLDRAFRGEPI